MLGILGVKKLGGTFIKLILFRKKKTLLQIFVAPRMKVFYPTQGDEDSSEAPFFLFDIEEPNIYAIYYTLSGSPRRHSIEPDAYSGQIDQSAWNRALNRTIVITFYAIDDFGNMAKAETTVTRTDYTEPAVDESPGFHNFFNASWEEWSVLGIVGAVMFIALYAYHRGDWNRVPKVPQEGLIHAHRRQ